MHKVTTTCDHCRLRVEVVLVSVSYFGLLAQMIFGITAIWTFHRSEYKYLLTLCMYVCMYVRYVIVTPILYLICKHFHLQTAKLIGCVFKLFCGTRSMALICNRSFCSAGFTTVRYVSSTGLGIMV